MDVFARCYRLQKAGNTFEECEDRAYSRFPSAKHDEEFWEGRVSSKELISFAVADGATEGLFSGSWAEKLVKAYCRSMDKGSEPYAFFNDAFKAWEYWLQEYLNKRKRQNNPIKWFEEPGLEAGAFSTLLGFTLADSGGQKRWKAFAAGDCCLFQVRDNELLRKFPVEKSEEFGNRPFLICSKAVLNDKLIEACRVAEGDFRVGDVFYLMTDALACWFIKNDEANNHPWVTLSSFNADFDAFQKWVDGLRDWNSIKNDDVTLVSVEVRG